MYVIDVRELLADTVSGSTGKPLKNQRGSGCLKKLGKVFLLLAVAVGAGAYFSRGWIAQKTEALIIKELDARGLYLDYQSVRWSWTRGLVISGFTLFGEEERTTPLLVVTDLAARIPLAELLTDGRAVGVFSTKGSDVIFYGERECKLSGFEAKIELDRKGIAIRRSEGNLAGLDLDIEGQILWGEGVAMGSENPSDVKGGPKGGKIALDFSFMDDVALWFAVETSGVAPRLEVRFDGDLSRPMEFVVEGEFRGEDFRWRGLPLKALEADFLLAEGAVDAKRVLFRHADGAMELSAHYGIGEGTVKTEGKSEGINFFEVVGQLPFETLKVPEGVRFASPPSIVWKGEIPILAPMEGTFAAGVACEGIVIPLGESELDLKQLSGQFVMSEGVVKGQEFTGTLRNGGTIKVSGSGGYSLASGNFEVKEIELEHNGGRMEGAASWDQASGKLVTRGTSKGIDVMELRRTLPFHVPLPEGMAFVGMPEGIWDATISTKVPGESHVKAEIGGDAGLAYTLGDREYRLRPLSARIETRDGVVMIRDLAGTLQGEKPIQIAGSVDYLPESGDVRARGVEVGHAGGRLSADVEWESRTGTLMTRGTSSGLDFLEFSKAFPLEVVLPDGIGLVGIPDLGWDMMLRTRALEQSVAAVNIGGDGGFSVRVGEKPLVVRPVVGQITLSEGILATEKMEVGILGGGANLRMQARPFGEKFVGTAAVAAGGIRLQAISDLLATGESGGELAGVLAATYAGTVFADINAIEGRGAVSIADGDFYTIPVLGPIHIVLSKVAPNFGKDVAGTLTADYVIGGGSLSTENLEIESTLSRIEARGQMRMSDTALNLTVNANLKGVVGVATALASKLLEIEVTGTVSEPQIQLKNNPLNGSGIGSGIASGIGNVVGGVGDGVKGVASGVGTMAKGVGNGVKKVGVGLTRGVKGALDKLKQPGGREKGDGETEPGVAVEVMPEEGQ